MGLWGIKPTQCDEGLDWLEAVWQRTGLVAELAKGLTADIHEVPDTVRCAAYFVERLGNAGLLLDHQRDVLTDEASSQLQKMINEKIYTNPAIVADMKSQIRNLADLRRGGAEKVMGRG